MKKWCVCIVLVFVVGGARAQKEEAQQLMMNLTKLEQFRAILQQLYEGYEILAKGYGMVKDVAEGNFSLHEVFLDALFEVSPAVRKYHKIADIVEMQVKVVQRYKRAYDRFKQSGQFSPEELLYLGRVYGRLTDQSLKNVEDLLTVVTAGKLRMSDEERLAAIDAIHAEVLDQLRFLGDFNSRTTLLAAQRQRESGEVNRVKALHQN